VTAPATRWESVGAAKVDLNGHEAGNGGYSQGTPKARRAFLYSEIAHRRMVAGRGILRNLGRNNNSPATRVSGFRNRISATSSAAERGIETFSHDDRHLIYLLTTEYLSEIDTT
jgi:hypothetical protein